MAGNNMDVNFEYYKIFYYVAKYRNFTRAAMVLGNSQPNVTRAMNCLEQQVHTTLFVRTNRGVHLTAEGERLYAHVSKAMEHILEAEEELAGQSGVSKGSVSIGASETALNLLLLDKLKTFHSRYPQIRLKIYNYSTPQAIGAVRKGMVDFAVVSTPAGTEMGLKAVRLMDYQEVLIGGMEYAGCLQKKLEFKEISSYPFIGLGKETVTYQFYKALFAAEGAEYCPDTETATADQILPLVKSGLGLAFLPEAMVKDAIDKGEVAAIQLKKALPKRSICLIYDGEHPFGEAAIQLRKIVRS